MRILLQITVLLYSAILYAHGQERPLRTIVHFKKDGAHLSVFSLDHGTKIPSIIKDQKVKDLFKTMQIDDQAIIEGHIIYETANNDGGHQLKPVFVIEGIHPISLKQLGQGLSHFELPPGTGFNKKTEQFVPSTIPVTTEVASAITLTSSLLMMESLSSGPGDPEGRRDLRKSLFISAGVMATILFIYEQLEGKTKP